MRKVCIGMAVLLVFASVCIVAVTAQELQIGIYEVKDLDSPIGATICRAEVIVTEIDGTTPIPNAIVVLDGALTTTTNQNGRVTFDVSRGWHTITVSKFDPVNDTCHLNGSKRFECCGCGNKIFPRVKLQRCQCPPGELNVTKVVVGGPLNISDFPLWVANESVNMSLTSSVPIELSEGNYTVGEISNNNYTAEFVGCCDQNGSVMIVSGQSCNCTITNTYIPPPTPTPTPPPEPTPTLPIPPRESPKVPALSSVGMIGLVGLLGLIGAIYAKYAKRK